MNKELSKKQKEKIDKLVEMGSLLTKEEFFEQTMKATGVTFIDCTPKNERKNRKNK
jgi:uncharacterized protein YjgD (DUF1641 family)